MNIKREICIDVNLSPSELAEEFWSMDEAEQATFFNKLGEISSGKLPMQLQYISTSSFLEQRGRMVMQMIGDYS